MADIGPLLEGPSSSVNLQGKPEDKWGKPQVEGMLNKPVNKDGVEKGRDVPKDANSRVITLAGWPIDSKIV